MDVGHRELTEGAGIFVGVARKRIFVRCGAQFAEIIFAASGADVLRPKREDNE